MLPTILTDLLKKVDGYKTYIGAAGMALLALMLFLNGDYVNAWWLLSEATGVGGLRAAIAKLIEELKKRQPPEEQPEEVLFPTTPYRPA